jgi:dihydrofolate reductase
VARGASKLVAVEHLSLDGVYQAPARIDEDTRDGFEHGGWSAAGDHPEMQKVIASYMSGGWSLLAGTTTYEDLYEGWHVRQPSSPMTQALTKVQKYVVTRNPAYKPIWANSTLVAGEGTGTVAKLKAEHDKTLIIFGSGALVRSLMADRLVDDYVLMIHPLVLGKGRRFFDESAPFTELKMIDKLITPTGVVVATYQPA